MTLATTNNDLAKKGFHLEPRDEVPLSVASLSPVPETWVDGMQGVIVRDGVIKLNLFSDQLNTQTKEMVRYQKVCLAMSVNCLMGIHAALGELVESLQGDQLLLSMEPKDE